MKSGTTEPIRIRRYGRLPPPPLESLDDGQAPRPGIAWRRVAITLAGLAVAAAAAASVSLLRQ